MSRRRKLELTPQRSTDELPVVCGGDSLVHLVFQLRGSAGDLFCFPAAGAGIGAEHGSARAVGERVCLGLRIERVFRGICSGSGFTEEGDPDRALCVELHLHVYRLDARLQLAVCAAGGGGTWRNDLLSGGGIAGQRLSREEDAIAGAGDSSDQRLRRDDRGWILC